MFFTENEIDRFIEEDLPYFDITTDALGIGDRSGSIIFSSRSPGVLACSEEAARILKKLGAWDVKRLPSGTRIDAGTPIIEAKGSADALHKAWKVCQNLLEYAGSIATYTHKMVEKAGSVPVFATRKSQPGFKKIAMKAVVSGGGHPHRMGLSETFLLFGNHRAFMDRDELLAKIESLQKGAMLEKLIAIETDSLEDTIAFAERGVRLFQLEKFPPKDLEHVVRTLKTRYPDIRLLATGGITLENIEAYAKTGIDGIITTAPYYYAKSADIRVQIEKVPV